MARGQPEREPVESLPQVDWKIRGLDESARLAEEADARKLVQELQLHKIELELQNDELLRIQAELRASWQQVDHMVMERTAELTRTIESLAKEVRQRGMAEAALRAAYAEVQGLRDRLQAENTRLRRELGH